MGKNSAKKAAKLAAKLANKESKPNPTAQQGANVGNPTAAKKQDTKTVILTDLADIATVVAPPPTPTIVLRPKITLPAPKPESPQAPPPVAVVTDTKYKEGYILETIVKEDGTPNYTKVMVEGKDKNWDVILCSRPAVIMTPGTLIRYIPGEYQGRPTVTSLVIVEKNTPLSRFFAHLVKVAENNTVEEITPSELAKTFMSTNHVGVNEEERMTNFIASQEVIKVLGQLNNGRWIVVK